MNINNNIKLNLFIFREVAGFLAYKKNFKELLELGLLSRSCFKIFQNIISQSNFYNIVLEFHNFKNYILKSNNEIHYKEKLIQYKDIESLCLDLGISCDYDEKKFSFVELQKFLLNNCPSLKHVEKNDVILAKYFQMNGGHDLYDRTMNGFYNFKRLIVNWENFLVPASNQRELEDTAISVYSSRNYEFSFEFLKYYMPKKVYISTNPNKRVCLEKINHILDCQSIESIHFFYQDTPKKFIKSALELSRIRSLTILYDLENDQDFLNTFKELSNSNTTLKKLRFKMGDDKYYENGFSFGSDTHKLFKLLKSNQSITSLGFEYYNISSSSHLEPLKQFSNIQSLYCNEKSLISFLIHIKTNPNIKKLKCVKQLYDDWENFDWKKKEIEKLIKEVSQKPPSSPSSSPSLSYSSSLFPPSSSLESITIEIEVFEFFEKKNIKIKIKIHQKLDYGLICCWGLL
ncbi:hypothetical protein DICPUDRAFT_150798 [Dictyostelium purpureum]|uniref:Uncharacterized protein n=1 Tax=Dictyostelium purpureum TaxID=5786 RepID=F0ZHA0_DICPU|nr:uncharacterized protein DICPUDRAFT_150798 [Dictyostelium purpureum]EGC36689.1 hypothetical protein DICPUDRAFT_150798 [Dictyostelium purpureum]|eukprot:XP_003286788.1 hypothetical protein DICPUDRAFT_150798 [Dictyostelium purpureum]